MATEAPLALEGPEPIETIDPVEDTLDSTSPSNHLRAKLAVKPAPAGSQQPVYDVTSDIKVPTFDPAALMASVARTAGNSEQQVKDMEREIDDLVLKGIFIGNGLTPEVAGMKGLPGKALLQRTEAMEAKARRAAGVLEQYVKFPPQPIEVHYEVMGGDAKDSVPVLITPRSRKGLEGSRVIAKTLVQKYACKCIIWDRPNTGRSGISWEGYGSEAELQSDYLNLLLAHLNISPVVLYGEECGGRLALIHALRYPEDVGGLILENVPAGQAAARYFARKHYLQYLDTMGIYNKDGLIYVAKEKHYANLLAGNPQNARRLLSIEHTDFKAILNRWARPLAEGGDKWMYPVLGLEGSKLRELKVPAVCLFTWAHSREEDSMHTEETMTSLVDCLAGAYPMVISPDGKGNTYDAELGIWINGLPRPLVADGLRPKAAAAAATVAADFRTTAAKAMGVLKVSDPSATGTDTCSLFQGVTIAGQMQMAKAGPAAQQAGCSVM